MSETQELAAALLPVYLEWVKTLPANEQGYSLRRITKWAWEQLHAYNSLGVIEEVTKELDQLVLNQIVDTITMKGVRDDS